MFVEECDGCHFPGAPYYIISVGTAVVMAPAAEDIFYVHDISQLICILNCREPRSPSTIKYISATISTVISCMSAYILNAQTQEFVTSAHKQQEFQILVSSKPSIGLIYCRLGN